MSKTYLGYLLTILSALAFASMSLFIKFGYGAGMSAWSFSVIQSSMALAVLGIMWLREPRRRGPLPLPWVLLFLLCGATSGISFNVALVHLSISLATILLFTYPAFTAVGAWLLLGQRPTLAHGVALLLTLGGATLTANLADINDGTTSLLGVGLALLAAVAHGLYIVVGEKIAGGLTATAANTLTRIAILSGSILLYPRVFAELPGVSARGWLICAVAAAVAGVAPFQFLNRGIALIGANRAAIASVAELPFALALGMLFQGDIIRPAQWVGALLIVAAVLVSQHESEGESANGPGAGTAGSL
ncbi:MAG TPA: DMT family transporter [Symbiobacteriaceae bacterium]|nr:DMT family transporter [Symbiobacteriaceae bacterium]